MPTGTGSTANPGVPYVWLLVCTNQPPDAQVQDPPVTQSADVRYVDLQPLDSHSSSFTLTPDAVSAAERSNKITFPPVGEGDLGHCPEPGYTLRFMKSYALVNESGDELHLAHVMEGFGGGFVTVISFFVLGIIGAVVLRALRPVD